MKANFLQRLAAVLIDAVLLMALGFGGGKLVGAAGNLAGLVYEVCFLVLWNGQTLGKKIMGIRVQGVSGNWGKAVVRSLMKILSAIPLGLGFFWMLWDKKGQTWHDKVAETSVVKE
jgi:uncharacterized RDD family membrane protein YckC